MIITTKDYDEFKKKYAYLTAELLTIFVEHPVVFLGYSVRDANITEILNSITECIGYEKAIEKFENKLIFIEWDEDIKEPEMTMDRIPVTDSKYIKMKNFKVKDYHEIFQALSEKKSRYPISFLKKLKNDLYKMANNTDLDTLEKVKILPDEFNEEETEFVMGIALEERIKYIKPHLTELFEDVIFNKFDFPVDIMVEKALPDILKHSSFSASVYKYLSEYSKPIPEFYNHNKLPKTFSDFLTKKALKYPQNMLEKYRKLSVREFYKNEYKEPNGDLLKFTLLEPNNINLDEFLEIIQALYYQLKNPLQHKHQTIRTDFRRLVKMYDFLKYQKENRNLHG